MHITTIEIDSAGQFGGRCSEGDWDISGIERASEIVDLAEAHGDLAADSPRTCTTCEGEGENMCEECEGEGRLESGDHCDACAAYGRVECDNCTNGIATY